MAECRKIPATEPIGLKSKQARHARRVAAQQLAHLDGLAAIGHPIDLTDPATRRVVFVALAWCIEAAHE